MNDAEIYIQTKVTDVIISGKQANWKPKSKDSIRRVPMTSNQGNIIKKYLSWREKILEKKQKNHNYVIFQYHGGPVQEVTFNGWMNEIELEFTDSNKTFIRNLASHTLRRSFATRVYEETKNLRSVQLLLGHSSITQTEIYLSLSLDKEYDNLKNALLQAGF